MGRLKQVRALDGDRSLSHFWQDRECLQAAEERRLLRLSFHWANRNDDFKYPWDPEKYSVRCISLNLVHFYVHFEIASNS